MKLAIIGGANGWHHLYDVEGELKGWEVWSCNELYRLDPSGVPPLGATRWFEIHGDTPLTRARRRPEHWEELEKLGLPIYTLFTLPGITRAVSYPIDDAARIRDYFACTFAYQIALGLLEGLSELRLYGVALTANREALVEAKCVDWWLGYCAGKDIPVSVIHDAPFGLGKQPYRYAYNDQAERYTAYRFAYDHYEGMTSWIQGEEVRLGLRRPWWDPWMRRLARLAYGRRSRAQET